MNQACVSLEEVFAAAGARAASLVPETSGYLALAVADATSRLPCAHDDRAVLLTVDGSVMVPRKGAATAAPEAARGLRDLLRRLLATSTGSMPGLTNAARARAEEHDVERVVGDIEAALIPVNRAAAKRALARLSRETLRAKEAGKLKKKAAPPAPQPSAPKAPAPMAAEPKVIIAAEIPAAPRVAVAPPAPPAPPVVSAPVVVIAPPAPPAISAPVVAVAAPAPVVAIAPVPPPPVVLAPVVVAAPEVVIAPAPAPALAVVVKEPELVLKAPDFVAKELELAAKELESKRPPSAIAAPIPEPALLTPTPIEVDFSPVPAADFAPSDGGLAWSEGDATIADPEAMAVIEAIYREAESTPQAIEIDWNSDSAQSDCAAVTPSTEVLTKPWGTRVNEVATSREAPAPPALAAPAPLSHAVMEMATPSELTADAPQTAMFTTPEMSRADELLHAFRAEDQGDPAVLAAAGSLREFTGVDESPSPRAARAPADRATYMARKPAPAYRDIDDELPVVAPRAREQGSSRWPLALFAVGVLVLFAAWLYRPTLAHDFFGLRQLVAPAPSPAAAPPHGADTAPEPAAPAVAPRSRETRAEGAGAEGARRRRD